MGRNMIIVTSRKFHRGGGIPVSTENLFNGEFKILFKKQIGKAIDPSIDALSTDEEIIDACADYPEVLFSGYDVCEESILRTLKEQGKRIIVFWHFAVSVLENDTHMKNWASIMKCAKEGYIDLMLTCKADFDKMWEKFPTVNHVPILRLRNNVMDSSYKDIPKQHMAGVYSGSGDFWVKNSKTNIAALATFDNNMPVDITPLSDDLKNFAEDFGLKVTGVNTLPHDEFLRRMANCELVMYGTFTEADPMLIKEAMNNGSICFTGPNHDTFRTSPFLENTLVVNRPDDAYAIAKQIEKALPLKNEIFAEYEACKAEWDRLYQQDLDRFLNYDFTGNAKTYKRS